MTIELSTITVAGKNVRLAKAKHPEGTPEFADFEVQDTNGVNIGRIWEYEGKWRAKAGPGERFVELPKMLEALEVVVRMRRMTTDQAGLHVSDGSEWIADGQWHGLEEIVPATGFLNGLIMHTCPSGPSDTLGLCTEEGDVRQTFTWEGHTPFAVVVEWVESWFHYEGALVVDSKGNYVDSDGRPLRRVPNDPSRPGPVQWERLEGKTPFILGYMIEAC